MLYSSLQYLHVDDYFPERKQPCIQAVSGMEMFHESVLKLSCSRVQQGWDEYCPAGKCQWKMPENSGMVNTPKITEVANSGIYE